MCDAGGRRAKEHGMLTFGLGFAAAVAAYRWALHACSQAPEGSLRSEAYRVMGGGGPGPL
jgi:hypothetical protein